MQEHIKELLLASWARVEGPTESDNTRLPLIEDMDQVFQAFAEAIIDDVVNLLANNNPPTKGTMYALLKDEYFAEGWVVAVETKMHQIKRAFGIK